MSQPNIHSPDRLTAGEAGSRLVVVILIQSLGLLLIVPFLIAPATNSDGWQRSCLWFSGLAGLGWVALFLASCFSLWQLGHSRSFNVAQTELAITLAFVFNTVALSLAMARTGGPTCSIFGQIIPMQLAGILLLEQQKETFTSKRSYFPAIYAAITLIIWGFAVLSSQKLAAWRGWALNIAPHETGYGILSHSRLILFEIVFMAVAYFLPQWFSNRGTS